MSTSIVKAREAAPIEKADADFDFNFAYVAKARAEASEKAARTARDFAAFNQATVDAFTRSGEVLAAGSMDMLGGMASSGQAAMAETLDGLRSLVVAKTVKEWFGLQASLSHASAKWALTETSRFGSASITLSQKVAAPLIARAEHMAETFKAMAV